MSRTSATVAKRGLQEGDFTEVRQLRRGIRWYDCEDLRASEVGQNQSLEHESMKVKASKPWCCEAAVSESYLPQTSRCKIVHCIQWFAEVHVVQIWILRSPMHEEKEWTMLERRRNVRIWAGNLMAFWTLDVGTMGSLAQLRLIDGRICGPTLQERRLFGLRHTHSAVTGGINRCTDSTGRALSLRCENRKRGGFLKPLSRPSRNLWFDPLTRDGKCPTTRGGAVEDGAKAAPLSAGVTEQSENEKEEELSTATLLWRAAKLPIYSVCIIPLTVNYWKHCILNVPSNKFHRELFSFPGVLFVRQFLAYQQTIYSLRSVTIFLEKCLATLELRLPHANNWDRKIVKKNIDHLLLLQ